MTDTNLRFGMLSRTKLAPIFDELLVEEVVVIVVAGEVVVLLLSKRYFNFWCWFKNKFWSVVVDDVGGVEVAVNGNICGCDFVVDVVGGSGGGKGLSLFGRNCRLWKGIVYFVLFVVVFALDENIRLFIKFILVVLMLLTLLLPLRMLFPTTPHPPPPPTPTLLLNSKLLLVLILLLPDSLLFANDAVEEEVLGVKVDKEEVDEVDEKGR